MDPEKNNKMKNCPQAYRKTEKERKLGKEADKKAERNSQIQRLRETVRQRQTDGQKMITESRKHRQIDEWTDKKQSQSFQKTLSRST